MRFLKNSPSIPDELLQARDEGRVVFFCGAGVSRAKANLKDFFGLTEEVINRLRLCSNHPARKILAKVYDFQKEADIGGLISADLIFGKLEQEFGSDIIESKVAESLKPENNVDLSAHQILIDLATTPDGKLRLVTTNFDRLFEACDPSLKKWLPPKLPDTSNPDDLDGVIHLHGCVNEDYSSSQGGEFILTSSEFGRAYLAEGWATQFFKNIISAYYVVFVGYSADDPPIRYLLEAFNKKRGILDRVYAFQDGMADDAAAMWAHKGVTVIPYDADHNHQALWETLSKWSERAKNPDAWIQKVIKLAQKDPEYLEPHERGMVAHLISTDKGAKLFSSSESPPPAEWLCVFDPECRYKEPRKIRNSDGNEQTDIIYPFTLYGLDSDVEPHRLIHQTDDERREIISKAWDGLAENRVDKQYLRERGVTAIHGANSTEAPGLPPRLRYLSHWILNVSDQPAFVWWAARQTGIHPEIQKGIEWRLGNNKNKMPNEIRKAWLLLLDVWGQGKKDDIYGKWHIPALVTKFGWDSSLVIKYISSIRPYLKAGTPFRNRYVAPKNDASIKVHDILKVRVEYPETTDEDPIPVEWLSLAVREYRKNLEYVLQLDKEVVLYDIDNIDSIFSGPDPNHNDIERTYGLSGYIIQFSNLFSRLIDYDPSLAKKEFDSWPDDDGTIFARLRIWACGKGKLVPNQIFDKTMMGLSDDVFWNWRAQRDILYVIKKRWNGSSSRTQKRIENRILKGANKWDGEDNESFIDRKARYTLNRLVWLSDKGCIFSFDLEKKIKEIQKRAPSWKREHAANAAGIVLRKPDSDFSCLQKLKIRQIIPTAIKMRSEHDYLFENRPFSQLVEDHPKRAFSALVCAGKQKEYPGWAWRTFLNSNTIRNQNPVFHRAVAEVLLRYPDKVNAELIHALSSWLQTNSQILSKHFPDVFDKIIPKLIGIIRNLPEVTKQRTANDPPDWVMESINSPTGMIIQALFNDVRFNNLNEGGSGPPDWTKRVEELLSLPGDLKRYALVIVGSNFKRLSHFFPSWTDRNVLSELDNGDENTRSAILCGFLRLGFFGLSAAQKTYLYIRLKKHLLEFAKNPLKKQRGYVSVVSAIIIAGWNSTNDDSGKPYISNQEMTDVLLNSDEEFRLSTLRNIEKWLKNDTADNTKTFHDKIIELFRDVWPLQTKIRTLAISDQLCHLIFSLPEHFMDNAFEQIIPLLTTIRGDRFMMYPLKNMTETFFDLYSKQTLKILCAVLSSDAASWPYGMDEILDKLAEADDSIKNNEDYIRLRRIWDSR